MIDVVVRRFAATVVGVRLVEVPPPPGDPDSVTLTLRCRGDGAFDVTVRVSPDGDALLWVGSADSALGPVELGPEDAADVVSFLDAVVTGAVEVTVINSLRGPVLASVAWPAGRWLASVSVGAWLAGLITGRRVVVGRPSSPGL